LNELIVLLVFLQILKRRCQLPAITKDNRIGGTKEKGLEMKVLVSTMAFVGHINPMQLICRVTGNGSGKTTNHRIAA